MSKINPVIVVVLGDCPAAFYCEKVSEAQTIHDTTIARSVSIIISPETAEKILSGDLLEIEI